MKSTSAVAILFRALVYGPRRLGGTALRAASDAFMEVECEMQPTVVIPARIDPPAEPLSLLPLLHAVARNPIESWPRAVYREHLYRSRMPGRDAVFVMHPALIQQVLVDEADAFEKGVMARRALEPVLGDAILIAEGVRMAAARRSPLFRREQLLQSCPRLSPSLNAPASAGCRFR
jgi:hypothetical protein